MAASACDRSEGNTAIAAATDITDFTDCSSRFPFTLILHSRSHLTLPKSSHTPELISHSHVMASASLSTSANVLRRGEVSFTDPVTSQSNVCLSSSKSTVSGVRLSSGNLDCQQLSVRHSSGKRSSGQAVRAGLFDFFTRGNLEKQTELKASLLESVKSLDRGANADPEDQDEVEAVSASFIFGDVTIFLANDCRLPGDFGRYEVIFEVFVGI